MDKMFRDAGDLLAHVVDDIRKGEFQMDNEFQHGDRVELTSDPMAVVGVGDAGTVTHLNGDGEPGTESYWPALDGDRVVWVEWDHAEGELGPACWTEKDSLSKL